ncbi:MAG: prolyl-tRNA synthetase associated domain-containing protein [Patescibacteria group bacterium]|jgi:Ala-tRNA(Pro) deacylase
MQLIYDTLAALNIPYQTHSHPPVFTSAEAAQYFEHIPGAHVKNLFLRNRKGDKHYLLIVLDNKTVNLKQLAQLLNEKQLSFASPDRLMRYLQVTPGSVSALGVVFDTTHAVTVLCDSAVQTYTDINLHPNINTKTLQLALSDLQRYFAKTGHAVQFILV